MTERRTPAKDVDRHPDQDLDAQAHGVEQGVVRQSFSHGRTKAVVVEKVKRRMVGPGEAKAEAAPAAAPAAPSGAPHAASAAGLRPRPPACRRRRPRPGGKPSGVVLRTLTEEERSARAHALADAKVREAEERRIAEEDARRRNEREARERAEREAAEARKREEDERRRHDEEAKRKAETEAKKRFGEDEKAEGARRRPLVAPPFGDQRAHRGSGTRRGRGAADRRARPGARRVRRRLRSRPADRRREAPRPAHPGDRAHGGRGARAFGRVVPPPHAAPDQGPCRQRAEGKAGARGDDPRGRSPSRSSPTACPSARSTSSSC